LIEVDCDALIRGTLAGAEANPSVVIAPAPSLRHILARNGCISTVRLLNLACNHCEELSAARFAVIVRRRCGTRYQICRDHELSGQN
jgi:hypothetical protein